MRGLDETVRTALLRAQRARDPGRDARAAREARGASSPSREAPRAARRAAWRRCSASSRRSLRRASRSARSPRPLGALPGFGPKRAAALARRGLRTCEDLLFHLPARYDDRTRLARIGELQVGLRATFAGEVLLAGSRACGAARAACSRRCSATAPARSISSGSARRPACAGSVKKGARLLVSGEVRRFRFSKELIHPEVELLREGETAGAHLGVVPDYPAIEGIPPRDAARRAWSASSRSRRISSRATCPTALARKREAAASSPRRCAACTGPRPSEIAELKERRGAAFDRLVLEELFLLEIGLALRRAAREREPGIALAPSRARRRARRRAPAVPAHRRAGARARARSAPTSRARTRCTACSRATSAAARRPSPSSPRCAVRAAGHQSALMAPTELLAEQHERTLRRLGVRGRRGAARCASACSPRRVPRARAAELRERARAGEVDLLVGTHALVQADVGFARLALVVVDEQHRFGVLQRAALAGKGGGPAAARCS